MLKISLISVLAVWGAFVATFVLLWDIYKWKMSGPKVSFSASADWQLVAVPFEPGDRDYISVHVTNAGDRPTTITNLGFRWYKSWMATEEPYNIINACPRYFVKPSKASHLGWFLLRWERRFPATPLCGLFSLIQHCCNVRFQQSNALHSNTS